MASLYEYFVKDGARDLTAHRTWQVRGQDGTVVGDVIARLHLDFHANAKYVSFFIPRLREVDCPEAILANQIGEILKLTDNLQVSFGVPNVHDTKTLVFTGQVYFYSEHTSPLEALNRLKSEAAARRCHFTIFSQDYVDYRDQFEKPKAFICHDSRDKKEMAEPLALQLLKWTCPVWYDDFSLKNGDSLRESIEGGLKRCPKCIILLTPHFLSNSGWARRDYDSIFTRELVDRGKVILTVWGDVRVLDVYKYSPVLADRVAIKWSEGVEQVARKLLRVIDAPAV